MPCAHAQGCIPERIFNSFGSPYTCALTDTVTEGGDEGEGSFEYLVFQKVLVQLAKTCDLHPVTEYDDYELDEALEQPVASSDGSKLFRRFSPVFKGSHPSLVLASRLNCAFVLRKGPLPETVPTASAPISRATAAHKRARMHPDEDQPADGALHGAAKVSERPGASAAVAAAAEASAREAEQMRRLAEASDAPQYKRPTKFKRQQ